MSILEHSPSRDAIVESFQRPLYRAAAIFAAWTTVGLLIASQTQLELTVRSQRQPTWSVLAPSMVGAWIWASYTPGVIWIARNLRRLRDAGGSPWKYWAWFFSSHLLVVAILVPLDALLWTYVRPFIDGVQPPLTLVIATTMFFNVAAYLAVVAMTEAGEYASRWREREREAAKLAHDADTLQGKLNEARLRALEGQLQPHFLYNTLNMVAELVHDEPDVADEMLIHLGALLRRSFRETGHVVPLKEEIYFVRAYAELLARRYRDRVTLAINLPAPLERYLVPAFVLQPLVENAFRHGVEQREGPSVVGVMVMIRDGTLVIRVDDRGSDQRNRPTRDNLLPAAISSAHLDIAAHGVGLRNIRERLAALYGSAAGLTLLQSPGETVATLWMPAAPVGAATGSDCGGEPLNGAANGVLRGYP